MHKNRNTNGFFGFRCVGAYQRVAETCQVPHAAKSFPKKPITEQNFSTSARDELFGYNRKCLAASKHLPLISVDSNANTLLFIYVLYIYMPSLLLLRYAICLSLFLWSCAKCCACYPTTFCHDN